MAAHHQNGFGIHPNDLDRRVTATVASDLPIVKGFTVFRLFRPLLLCLQYSGFLIISENASQKEQLKFKVIKGLRLIYLSLMWTWVLMMTLNVLWMAIVVTGVTGIDPTNGQHANIIITFLEESPYAFIALRNAVVLTVFVWQSVDIWDALTHCEELRKSIVQNGGCDPNFLHSLGSQPVVLVWTTIVLIILWEIYEWNVWFGTMGITYVWDMAPFPFFLVHYQYGILWWIFISIPFIFSQLAICFPTLFAMVFVQYIRYLNAELRRLDPMSKTELKDSVKFDLRLDQSNRIRELRRIHYEIGHSIRYLDKPIRSMLLMQFLFDMFVLFGFLGQLLDSKDCRPPKQTLEWTFYIPSSMLWIFFLLHYNFPLIQMTSEGEKTHNLVHALTFSWSGEYHEKMDEFIVFLDESRHTIFGFTGRKFYYVNRAYLVTCAAVIASYFTVLAEILDRFYGTEDIKGELKVLTDILHNKSTENITHDNVDI